MVGVEYSYGSNAIKKEVNDIRLLLSNRRGSYFMQPSGDKSRYDGFFVFDETMYKILDSLDIDFKILKNNIEYVEADTARFYLHPTKNALTIHTNYPVKLNFDIRQSYDARVWGRNYTIQEKDCTLINYTKTTDSREDPTHGEKEFDMHVAVRHNGLHSIDEKWVEKHYEWDKNRGSQPYSRHVFQPLRIKAPKIVITASKDKNQAIDDANSVFKHPQKMNTKYQKISHPEVDFAYTLAVQALDDLVVGRMFAGLPWFFQFWTRDEAISMGAYIAQNRHHIAKEILFKEIGYVDADGRIPNRTPHSDLGSADSLGWCLKRFLQLYEADQLDQSEIIFLKAKLQYMFERFHKNYVKNGLVYNKPKETWMDTEYKGDTREGARIEIQALQLVFYRLLYKLTKQERFEEMETEMLYRVQEKFWNGEILADGLNDFTIRPNFIIAHYVYPELLSKKDWIKCYERSIPKLWLSWGGLSTIDKDHELFQLYYTGQDNKSYHRGDSWYWINNMAALNMHRLGTLNFRKYIFPILHASTDEILWMGASGRHAEVSSAARQESNGCFSQGWSNAMYIEMIEELFN